MRNDKYGRVVYKEEDISDVQSDDVSSAGLPTRPLGTHLPISGSPEDASQSSDQRIDMLAVGLIVVGILALLTQFGPNRGEIIGGMVLLTIASCFLFFAFWQRIYGLLIPGCILAGLSVGVTFASLSNGVSVLWSLACGFLAILFIGRSMFQVHSNWPVFPAIPLFAVGIIIAVSTLPGPLVVSMIWLPLILIGAGIFLGWRRQEGR